jgi:hypothetical protein
VGLIVEVIEQGSRGLGFRASGLEFGIVGLEEGSRGLLPVAISGIAHSLVLLGASLGSISGTAYPLGRFPTRDGCNKAGTSRFFQAPDPRLAT